MDRFLPKVSGEAKVGRIVRVGDLDLATGKFGELQHGREQP